MDPAYTPQIDRVVQRARAQAEHLGHGCIDTEHLLLGLIEDGRGEAVTVLMNMGLNLRFLKENIEDYIADLDYPGNGEMDLAPRARHALELAAEEARQARKDYTGVEYLLLALHRDKESVAAQVLAAFGFDCRPNPLKRWRDELRNADDADLNRLKQSADAFLDAADSLAFVSGGFTDNRILRHLVDREIERRRV